MGPPTSSRPAVGLAVRGYRDSADLRRVLKGASAPWPTGGRRSMGRPTSSRPAAGLAVLEYRGYADPLHSLNDAERK
jgi:hypothetical protein